MVQKNKKIWNEISGVGEIVVLNCKVDRQPPFCTNSKKRRGWVVWYGIGRKKNKNMKFSAKRDDNDI